MCSIWTDTCYHTLRSIVYHYSFYIGHTPVLVVGNPEMVKEITIKQSSNFMDRSVRLAPVITHHDVIEATLGIYIQYIELDGY